MRIFLVRHGETEEAAAKIHQRHSALLSAKGIEQAKKVGTRLKDTKFEHIYISPLPRTLQTAVYILEYHIGTPVSIAPEAREIHFGDAQGQSLGTWQKILAASGKSRFDFVAPNGESLNDVRNRFIPFIESIAKKHTGDVLIVCHGFPILFALAHIQGMPENEAEVPSPKNTSLSIIELPRTVHMQNDASHLDE